MTARAPKEAAPAAEGCVPDPPQGPAARPPLLPGHPEAAPPRNAASLPPSAPEVFLRALTAEVKQEDVQHMFDTQRHMLSRFEKTNEMLLNFNFLSAARFQSTETEFRHHILLLADTKRELDTVFKRIRLLKARLAKTHPASFKVCTQIYEVPDDEELSEGSGGELGTPLPLPPHTPTTLSTALPTLSTNKNAALQSVSANQVTAVLQKPNTEDQSPVACGVQSNAPIESDQLDPGPPLAVNLSAARL